MRRFHQKKQKDAQKKQKMSIQIMHLQSVSCTKTQAADGRSDAEPKGAERAVCSLLLQGKVCEWLQQQNDTNTEAGDEIICRGNTPISLRVSGSMKKRS